jgi:[ribosomal protein S18]-alanine N-acetyltransferase
MNGRTLIVAAATDEDVAALAALEERCYTHPWTVRHFRDEIAHRGRGRVVLLRDPRGLQEEERGIWAYVAFQVVADEMHLLNLAVAPEWRGRGWGRWLLRLALVLGGRRGARRALLEVRRSNQAALALYQKAGFRQIAVRRNYYTRPQEDALVLEKADIGPGQVPRPS